MENKSNTTLRIINGGPLEVSGNFFIVDKDGTERNLGNKVFLCRCGKTANSPFCDGSHRKI